MKYFILTCFVFPMTAMAFTLNNNFEAAFSKKKVKVYIDRNTTCGNINLTIDELESMVKPAVEKFWNTVPTSKLRLKAGGFTGPIDNISSSTGRLCPPTDDACINAAGTNVIPPVTDIIIACNDNPDNFGTSGSNSNVLAVTVPNNFSGKKIKGAVILLNNDSGNFANLDHDDRVAVIAHEIGHAIGLGHSEDDAALMYYRTVNLRKKLGDDDVNGVSYLYPVHIDGCGAMGGLFGTIKTKNDDDDDTNFPFWPMVVSLFAMIGIFEVLKAVKKSRPMFRF